MQKKCLLIFLSVLTGVREVCGVNHMDVLFIMSVINLTTEIRASNVSHTVVLRPLKAGYFNFTSASVSYVAQEGGQVVVRSDVFVVWYG